MTQRRCTGIGLAVLLAAVVTILAGAGFAQTAADIAGRWRAELILPMGEIVIILDLTQDAAGAWTGTIASDADRNNSVALKELAVEGGRVSFLAPIPGVGLDLRYEGAIAGDKMKGTLTGTTAGRPAKYSLQFKHQPVVKTEEMAPPTGSPIVSYDRANPVSGSWTARSAEEDQQREWKLDLGRDGSGRWSGTLHDTATDETATLRDISFGENTVAFNYRPAGAAYLASFWGRYLVEDDIIKGSLSLGGRSQQLAFSRIGPAPEAARDRFAAPRKPRKHATRFAAAARATLWQPLYVLKQDVRNINDITTASSGFDAGVRWYVMDTFGVQARWFRGGLGFDTNDANLALFTPDNQGVGIAPAISRDTYYGVQGWEIGLMGYLGPALMPDSRFNPYVVFAGGKAAWEVDRSGRGSEPVAIFERNLAGTDWQFSGGLGTEVAINSRFGVELEWLWSYALTENTRAWENNVEQWTNTHVYRFSLGAVMWF